MSEVRLGQILVASGVLNEGQVEEILAVQERTGDPFGLIAERLCGVDPGTIEDAWAAQYARLTRTVDPHTEAYDDEAGRLITRRQAWQFRILPLRVEGREVIIATTQQHLRRALRFATNVIGVPIFFVMADAHALGEALCRRYPLPGMTPRSVDDDTIDRLLAEARHAAA
jgi:hypothetical protein